MDFLNRFRNKKKNIDDKSNQNNKVLISEVQPVFTLLYYI